MLPEWLPYALLPVALFGLLWGSFLNVCIYRVVRGLSVVTPRSFCPACSRQIAWYDNVPVLSFVLLRGRCRSCHAFIGLRYPFVEIVTSALLVAVASVFGFTWEGLKWGVLETLAIVLFSTDADTYILPDEFTLSGICAGFLFALLVPVHSTLIDVLLPDWPERGRSLLNAVVGLVALPLPLWGFAALYKRVRHFAEDPLGFGDVKLIALIGAFFGFERAVPVLMLGAVAGALVGLVYVAAKGRSGWRRELPFGSFLCASAALMALFERPPLSPG